MPKKNVNSRQRLKLKASQKNEQPETLADGDEADVDLVVSADAVMDHDGEEGDEEGDQTGTIDYQAYIPGQSRPLDEDEELVMDRSAYRLFFDLQVESSSLSFDIIKDNLGSDRAVEREGQPASLCLVAGTQASGTNRNKLVVMRLENLRPFRNKKKAEDDDDDDEKDDDDSDSDDSDDEEDLDAQPDVEAASILHPGTVNRIRVKHIADRCYAASWSEQGKVLVWDLTRPLNAVTDSAIMAEYTRLNESPQPATVFKGHKSEGWALDWSLSSGQLASGDCSGAIFHWQPNATGWSISPKPYLGHTSSVEDIQWSSTEPTVFISVSADASFRVWDTRSAQRKSMLHVPDAHSADINVASWNKLDSTKLVTGGDDACIRLWDLRNMTASPSQDKPSYLHSYTFHTKPITSIEWHPTDSGVFAASSEDNQVTLWDSTLVKATEEGDGDAEMKVEEAGGIDANVPDELLFIHSGQSDIKEVHWHPQLPGLLVSTALEGFNIWRTCNI